MTTNAKTRNIKLAIVRNGMEFTKLVTPKDLDREISRLRSQGAEVFKLIQGVKVGIG